ncbi:MAG: radical SAM protein [Candidatus Omnitrophota bacterium]|nr:cobalamin-dependent protein [Candidatus Omnitrophota bacterium]
MRIFLIEAEKDKTRSPTSDWFDSDTHKFLCPSLGPITLASLTPNDIEIKVLDEKIEEIDFDDLPDIAAISFKTMSSTRAYEIAQIYRKKNVKVILGGIHASLLPDEAKQYCDTVIIGEGEEVWPHVINDLHRNQLCPSYHTPHLTDLSTLPIPNFGLLQNERYMCHPIQASRGCSLNCDFCPTREMFGGIFRKKPIKKIAEEVRAALSIEKKYIFFTDDIFCAGDERFTLELLKEIRKLKIKFFIISDFLVLNKKIVIELARSGCCYLCLNLPGTCTREEIKAIKMMQMLGINVWGYFMFGFRFHGKDVFKKAYDFVHTTKMRHVSFTVMAPYPNTTAGKILESQGRILTTDWSLYDQAHVVCKPEKMSSQELTEGFMWIKEKLGYLSYFSSQERMSIWRTLTSKCLAETLGILPGRESKRCQ